MFYKGVTEPPVRWSAWQDLVAAFARHMVERYTLDVVAKFKFEVWNGQSTSAPHLDPPSLVFELLLFCSCLFFVPFFQ
jgi:beta-xylosidase